MRHIFKLTRIPTTAATSTTTSTPEPWATFISNLLTALGTLITTKFTASS
jgi:hypothetical protein